MILDSKINIFEIFFQNLNLLHRKCVSVQHLFNRIIWLHISKTSLCIKFKTAHFMVIEETKAAYITGFITTGTHKYELLKARSIVQFSGTWMTAMIHTTSRLIWFISIRIEITVANLLLSAKQFWSVQDLNESCTASIQSISGLNKWSSRVQTWIVSEILFNS